MNEELAKALAEYHKRRIDELLQKVHAKSAGVIDRATWEIIESASRAAFGLGAYVERVDPMP